MSPIAELTADELLHLNLPNKRTELVKGALMVREPPGYYHGPGFRCALAEVL